MRSKSSETAEWARAALRPCPPPARARAGGFTLIEVLAVVLIVGLVAGAVAAAAGAGSVEARQRRAVEDLAAILALTRAEAMQRSTAQRATIEAGEDGRLTLRAEERVREWPDAGLELAARGRTVYETAPLAGRAIDVAFDSLGRTSERVVVLDGREAGGRMWLLTFDPLSGAVDGAPADEG